jgi:hypothetical protein
MITQRRMRNRVCSTYGEERNALKVWWEARRKETIKKI